jgi:ammonia channel protein AmtB
MVRLEVDDPTDSAALHVTCGMWGLVAAALFTDADYASDYDVGHDATGAAGHPAVVAVVCGDCGV